MDTIDTLTKSFDKLFVTTAQNILGFDIKFCKIGFICTSIGIGLTLLINSFYLIKIKNENNLIKNKVNLLLNEQKLIIEGNISIYEYITKNINAIKNTNLIINDNKKYLQEIENERKSEEDIEVEGYDFLFCQ
jgi:hypothetical protein